jgi:hypothetical protein
VARSGRTNGRDLEGHGWSAAGDTIVSPDASRVVIVLRRSGKRQLHILSSDGTELQPIAEAIDVQGTGSWSPDGMWIAIGGSDSEGLELFKIPLDGGTPVRLVAGLALIQSGHRMETHHNAGTNVRTFAPLLAVRPNGTRMELPSISVRRLGERALYARRAQADLHAGSARFAGFLATRSRHHEVPSAHEALEPCYYADLRCHARWETNRLRPLARELGRRPDRASEKIAGSS